MRCVSEPLNFIFTERNASSFEHFYGFNFPMIIYYDFGTKCN